MWLRKQYLKRFVRALNAINPGNEEEVERTAGKIKVAADVSLALTVNSAAWSRALLNTISAQKKNRPALTKIVRLKKFEGLIAHKARCNSRLKRAQMIGNEVKKKQCKPLYRLLCCKRMGTATSSSHARKVRKLKRLVPGGKTMDTSCLLRETADYIASLTIQVDVLNFLLSSAHHTENPV